jgi:hypothetical protein
VRLKATGDVFFLLVLLGIAKTAFSAEPANGQWTWMQVVDYQNLIGATVGASCRVWLENYTGNSFRLWKRCGVNTTASGARFIDLTFPNGGNFNWSSSECGSKTCTQWSKDGGGALQTASSGPTINVQFYSGAESYVDAAGTFRFGTDKTVKNDYQITCTGQIVAGGVVNQTGVGGGTALQWSSSPYLRDTTTGNNTVSATCKAADTLIKDFGAVTSDCTTGGNIVSKVRGRAAIAASCGCWPIKYGIDEIFPGDICIFRPIHGDPGSLGNNNNGLGEFIGSQPGKTFTNADLAKWASGEEGIPVAGSGGGIAEGYGFTGDTEWIGGAGPSGTPTVGGTIGPSSGGSGGGGSGSCTTAGCLDEPTPDSGTIPGISSFDSSVTSPDETDWVDTIRAFITGNPIFGVISGSGVSATAGSCAVSTTIFGATVDFGFCDIPSGVWTTWGVLILAVAHLMAAYILFR